MLAHVSRQFVSFGNAMLITRAPGCFTLLQVLTCCVRRRQGHAIAAHSWLWRQRIPLEVQHQSAGQTAPGVCGGPARLRLERQAAGGVQQIRLVAAPALHLHQGGDPAQPATLLALLPLHQA
jgi:hypothetical protein